MNHEFQKRTGRTRRQGQSGVALLMVIITIAVLSVMVLDFVYQTRIDVQITANIQDRVKSYYLARSAVNFSRLILFFQGQVDRLAGGTIKLYQLIPIESDLAKALTSGEVGDTLGLGGLNLGSAKGFGNIDGHFSAEIEDEYSKINLNALDSIPSIAAPVAAQILSLIANPRYQAMFEAPDADGQYSTPGDVVAAMHDWIDSNKSMDALNPEVLVKDPFSQAAVFAPGTSSEDSRYDMLKDPYKNKNDPFITAQELNMIRGVTDDFMQEFGDKFTVYTDPSLLLNLTSVNDPMMMLSVLCLQPENQPLCTEQGLPALLEVLSLFFEFRNMMQAATFMVPDNQTIQAFFSTLGPTFNQYFLKNLAPFSDTFMIRATGGVGETTVSIKAVVKNTVTGQEILFWQVL